LGTPHQSWKAVFDARSSHTEDLKNVTCGLSSPEPSPESFR